MTESLPSFAAALRQAGHDLPPETLAALDQGHALLQAMLARLSPPSPDTEPATVFQPAGTPSGTP
jgi:hypothetical protein